MQERDRLTLRFRDRDLESAYQRAAAEQGRPALRAGVAAAIGLWVAAGALVPAMVDLDPAFAWSVAGAMAIANAVGYWLVGTAPTADRQNAIGATLNIAAAVALLALLAAADEFDRFATPVLMLLSIFAFLVLRLRSPLSIVTGVGYLVAYVLLAMIVASDPSAATLGTLLLGIAVGVGIMGAYLLEDAQRSVFAGRRHIAALHAQVDELFRRYLSPDVAAALLDDPDRSELGGDVVEVTILFADLAGYTPYSERTAPAEVVALLNAYFGAAVPIVLREGGTITQFIGDALMAIYNAPLRQEGHALRAARTAVAFQAAVDTIASIDAARPRFRVGIATGPALVGNIGSAELRNFAAIGDTTNLAARLQTYAEPGQIVVSSRTRELLGDRAIVRSLGELELKGKSTGTAAFELLGLTGDEAVAGS